jgi:hypothetical protein
VSDLQASDPNRLRRRLAPLLLVAAGLGALVSIQSKLPHDQDVVLDFGEAAASIADVELEWTPARAPMDEAALTTRWHFARGTAPTRLHTIARLPNGLWTADVTVIRATGETTHWSGRVNLEARPFWTGAASGETPVVLPVRQALR